jgi:HEXXH motif-containing protein
MKVVLDPEAIQRLAVPSGEADPLVRAVYTRRYNVLLLQLFQVSQRLASEAPELAEKTGFTQAFAALQACPPAVQRELIEYPTTAFWIHVASKLIERQTHVLFPEMHIRTHLEDFGRFALAAVFRAGSAEYATSVWTDASARIALPTTGTLLQCDAQMALQRVEVQVLPGRMVVRLGDDELPCSPQHILQLSMGIEVNDRDEDLRLARRTGFQYAQLDEQARSQWQEALERAWDLIAAASPALAEEIPLGVRVFVPVVSPSVQVHLSGTFHEAPGLVAMSWSPDPFTMAEAVAHEYHHQKLNALLAIDPLICGPTGEAIYYSPWRDDPRPLSGVLHATYTFLAILDFCEQVLATTDPEVDPERVRARMYEASSKIRIGLATLQEQAELTPLGAALVGALQERYTARSAHLPAVNATSREEIDGRMRQHREQWDQQYADLRQLVSTAVPAMSEAAVAQDAAHRALEEQARSYLQIRPDFPLLASLRARDPVDPTVGATRALHYGHQLDRLQAVLAQAEPGNSLLLDLLAGHVAYLLGDYDEAARRYKVCIEYAPDTLYLWECYAFALRHLHEWEQALRILVNLDALGSHAASLAALEADPVDVALASIH